MPLPESTEKFRTDVNDKAFGEEKRTDLEEGLMLQSCNKKDDRPIILLVVGLILIIFFHLRHIVIVPPSENHVRLQIRGGEIALDESSKNANEKVRRDPAMPAALTPFFFAPIPINEADLELLQTVSGIGPHLAAEIVKVRVRIGSFQGPEDLLKVHGIGPKKMKKFADKFSYR